MIAPIVPLTYYWLLIIAASIVGGMMPQWFRLTHRGMQIAVSFVAAMMLGVGMLAHAAARADRGPRSRAPARRRRLRPSCCGCSPAGVTMFFIERFFCFHHHDVETDAAGHLHEHEEACAATITATTSPGAAPRWGSRCTACSKASPCAASVAAPARQPALAGLGTFLVIFLHKPFDSMTIAHADGPRRLVAAVAARRQRAVRAGDPAGRRRLFYAGLASGADVGHARSPTRWPSRPARFCASR